MRKNLYYVWLRRAFLIVGVTVFSNPALAVEKEMPSSPELMPKAEAPVQQPVINVTASKDTQPFGSNLFSAQFPSGSKEPMNPNYQIVPGDQIDIQAWGAVSYNSTTTVDNQGNIFLPEIGPVRVQGVTQSALNDAVKKKVGEVYKDNVQIYTALRGSLPISVFVTGAVKAPGRYVGTSTDSVIDYIYKAGGIDEERGSYRSIAVIRNNEKVQSFDIYDFLMSGNMPKFQIREGDTVLVTERGYTVTVKGSVKSPYKFEFKDAAIKGADIIKYASPHPQSTNVQISGTRNGKPYRSYLTIEQFNVASLQEGDRVEFVAGTHEDKIAVTISGRHMGVKGMVVPLDAKLLEVLNNIPVDNNLSNVNAVYIKRRSVAEKQKQAIKDSLNRLQETILLARASGATASGADAVSATEATILNNFMEKAKQAEPEGKVVVTNDKGIMNIALEDGDEIIIPPRTDLVMVDGEVLIPKAIVWTKGDSLKDYVNKAGGYNDRANRSDLVVLKANGETVLGTSADIEPGDQIIVMPEIKINSLELASKVVDIVYKVAVATAIPFTLAKD